MSDWRQAPAQEESSDSGRTSGRAGRWEPWTAQTAGRPPPTKCVVKGDAPLVGWEGGSPGQLRLQAAPRADEWRNGADAEAA